MLLLYIVNGFSHIKISLYQKILISLLLIIINLQYIKLFLLTFFQIKMSNTSDLNSYNSIKQSSNDETISEVYETSNDDDDSNDNDNDNDDGNNNDDDNNDGNNNDDDDDNNGGNGGNDDNNGDNLQEKSKTSDVWNFVDKTTCKYPNCAKIFGIRTGTSSICTYLKSHKLLLEKEKQTTLDIFIKRHLREVQIKKTQAVIE